MFYISEEKAIEKAIVWQECGIVVLKISPVSSLYVKGATVEEHQLEHIDLKMVQFPDNVIMCCVLMSYGDVQVYILVFSSVLPL